MFSISNLPDSFFTTPSIGYKFGKSGFLLMNSLLYKNTQLPIYFDNIEIILTNIFEQIETGYYGERNFEELSDFLRILYFIEKNGILDRDTLVSISDKLIEEIDFYFSDYLKYGNDFHFCRGILVFANLFCETPSFIKNYENELLKIVEFLDRIAIRKDNYTYWVNANLQFENKIFNNSIYGNLSICKFLYSIHEISPLSISLLEECLDFILSQLDYSKKGLSIFAEPHTTTQNKRTEKPMLQWIDGSFNIMYSLIVHLGDILPKLEYDFILKNLILVSKLSEDNVDCTKISLGYGSTGVYMMFQNLFEKTGMQDFKEASRYWFNLSVERLHSKEKSFSQYNDEVRLTSFISGYSGAYICKNLYESGETSLINNLIYL
ncbi:lanthionine synthetase LanC family protein [Chryseobacterium sp. G0201]|uniref:lanthionine synthetase LanC family protein n=1 Tax=Chryseobacterium sp. G0201 TaxID=2487065 RepID=UPI000F4DB73E|nr:lanthionine synthetase LanC family protein [Chryseobacterium sp. G0201]AZA55193.1 hypothetical protein EG348_20420 [Chryseobacterium sp. G0201]